MFKSLVVPGLAERRPSLIVGDIIHVQEHAISSDQWFGGYVHVTEDYSVALKFATSFNSIRGERYDVRFSLSRGPLRRMHQSLDTACPARLLFPKPSHRHITLPTNQTDALSLFNRNIEQNPHQSLAVRSILHLPRGSPPFIVFGPSVFSIC
jgi:helicase MOV-10